LRLSTAVAAVSDDGSAVMSRGGERLPHAGRGLIAVSLLLHLCASSTAGAGSCSVLQIRLRGGEGRLDKVERIVSRASGLPGANTRLPADAKRVAGGADGGRRAVKRSRLSGPGAAAEGTAGSETRKLCPHQRQRSACKDCGGSSICPHQRIRSKCKECGGSSICPHQRIRSTCKDCGGASICPHQRQRSTCKECGGSSICPHQRIRSTCKECGGARICPHQRQRSHCKECGGSSICPHQRIRSTCRECGGASICPHQRQRSHCKECGGSSICLHQRIRSKCKECHEEADKAISAGDGGL